MLTDGIILPHNHSYLLLIYFQIPEPFPPILPKYFSCGNMQTVVSLRTNLDKVQNLIFVYFDTSL